MANPPPPPPHPKTTIPIIGAGIAGPLFALHLLSHPVLRERYHPIIYERLPENDGKSGAAVALTSNALFPLYELGLKSELDGISCETQRIRIWRALGGKRGKFLNSVRNPNWTEEVGSSLRVVERGALQGLLVDRVREMGGEVRFGGKVLGVESERGGEREGDGDGRGVKVRFEGGEVVSAAFVVGADGGWSVVRRGIIGEGEMMKGGMEGKEKEKEMIEQRWRPEFAGADVVYGVSRVGRESGEEGADDEGDTHWVFLDGGMASTWALPEGKVFWTLTSLSKTQPAKPGRSKDAEYSLYGAPVSLGGYTLEDTRAFLEKHEEVWHPTAGDFGSLFRNSERIVRTPLWYRAWEGEEIAGENVVLIGDAARLMLPTSGQGACFAIEDATVLANALLNNPPSEQDGRLDFSQAITGWAPINYRRTIIDNYRYRRNR
ncbi:FAD/NAD(P)-binding domain containing protein [Hyaloscypha variabilis]